MGSRVTLLGIVLTGLAVSLSSASTAEAVRTEFFGIVQGTLDAQDRQGMAAARVQTERFLLRWRSVEPSRGNYDWAQRDHFIGALASEGIRALPFVWGSPQWVGSGKLAQPPVYNAADEQAWRNFLKAAVARYGPGGTYWANRYQEQFGPGATPLPIKSWQIWNEPNLSKFFSPGQTVQQSAQKYARLLRISRNAITSQDPKAGIVLAGMPSYGDSTAWTFLKHLYGIPGARGDFDAAALHPYSCKLDELRQGIVQFRAAMTSHADGGTPLWLTELAWGSGPPDRFCKNKGPAGQQQLLRDSFKLILNGRKTWNVQRLYWFLWRDPEAGSKYAQLCSICGTAGVLRYDRTPKPAYDTFTSFTAETTPPQASITAGPSPGSFTNDPTPTFTFGSNEAGSTFECRFDATAFKSCSSPHTLAPLADGAHTFRVRAIDAPGNVSATRSRSFTVDTTVPAVTVTAGPEEGSTSSDSNASFEFASSESGVSFGCELDGGGFQGCSSPFTASGLSDSSHTFQVKATDPAQNTGVASRTWTIDTAGPVVTISSGPAHGSTSSERSPSFEFTANEPDVSFGCRLSGGGGFRKCSSPFTAPALADGSHTFQVKATDTAQNHDFASRTWTVDGIAEVSITAGPASGSAIRDPTPSFAFSSLDSDSDLRCRRDGGAFVSCTSPFTTSMLSDGSHTFQVKATDPAQNTDVAGRHFRVDTTAPVVRIRGQSRLTTRRRKASTTFILRSSEDVGLRCRIDSKRWRSCSKRYRTPKLSRGTHTLKVKATDRAGNVGTDRKRFRILRKRA